MQSYRSFHFGETFFRSLGGCPTIDRHEFRIPEVKACGKRLLSFIRVKFHLKLTDVFKNFDNFDKEKARMLASLSDFN